MSQAVVPDLEFVSSVVRGIHAIWEGGTKGWRNALEGGTPSSWLNCGRCGAKKVVSPLGYPRPACVS